MDAHLWADTSPLERIESGDKITVNQLILLGLTKNLKLFIVYNSITVYYYI